MARPRILILDDGVAWRRAFSRALGDDPAVEIVGSTELGEVGLEKFRQLHPDCVILGITEPRAEARALRTLEELRGAYPRLPIAAVSPRAERGSPMALEFLTHGASAFAAIPGMTSDVDPVRLGDELRRGVVAKLKLVPEKTVEPTRGAEPAPSPAPRRRGFEAVVIGVSTGGPPALEQVLGALPGTVAVPIFIVQHMLPTFTQSLTVRLDAVCALPVREAVQGAEPSPGHVWVAPDSFHLEVERKGDRIRMRLTDAPRENQCRPAADVLFRSAAQVYGANLLGVVLTGMGCDGLRGCREIRKAGGHVLVQDAATSVVWGMPGMVAEEGLAHEILPIGKIGPELARLVGGGAAGSRGPH